jgi:hypothetical protein
MRPSAVVAGTALLVVILLSAGHVIDAMCARTLTYARSATTTSLDMDTTKPTPLK